MTIWRCFAPAKVNLYLHVGPPRGDGRHPLDSLVVFADVGDTVCFTPDSRPLEAAWPLGDDGRPDFSVVHAQILSLVGPYGGALTEALASPIPIQISAEISAQIPAQIPAQIQIPMLSAAQGLCAAHGADQGGAWTLEKNLPIAAGLGGGTADTAAALRLANAAGGLGLDDAALARFAAGYGGDTPACIASRPVLMRDDGARLDLAPPLPDLHAVVVNPNLACSTAAVYRAFDAAGLGAGFGEVAPPQVKTTADLIAALHAYRNDLEGPAQQVQPAIAEVLAALRARPQTQLARVTGSGATCFALTDTDDGALKLQADLAAAYPAWWVRAARLGAVDATPRPV